MFVDASALVAILTGESDASDLAARLEGATTLITSPIAVYESVLAIARTKQGGIGEARIDVEMFLAAVPIRVVAVTPLDASTALDAFETYGKGRGHPAQLNMGDCFAYAAAKNNGVPLLFKGQDFIHTDIAQALA
ncbi:type II toxin-antitoxin system VapC family toxin [Methylobacterium sp. Leaf93]|uniref:type II toxin-antitoxin system VapC family toxin n=1 Tax=Methylobacterium sp. Leaf93 TaxID=1736249 RepID=UPI0006FC6DF6|nr:type II toxin-antitoxin system VapC family toxin [Methylobacterium sp. Leaf93]KQP12989.1 twitching motility protein PilT [Methylobacterium sp. Leaf93]